MSIPRAINPMPRETSRLMELAHDVREFKDTAPIKAVLELLQEIDAQTMQYLRRTAPEHLLLQQGKLAQLEALMSLLRGEPSNGMA